jgi:hypothetical protein
MKLQIDYTSQVFIGITREPYDSVFLLHLQNGDTFEVTPEEAFLHLCLLGVPEDKYNFLSYVRNFYACIVILGEKPECIPMTKQQINDTIRCIIQEQ